jgi:hypothetical protein
MPSETTTSWPLRDALRTAQAVLDNELDIIAASIKLAAGSRFRIIAP